MGYHYIHNTESSMEGISIFSNLEKKVDKKIKDVDRLLPYHYHSHHNYDDYEFAELNEIR